MIGFAGVLLLGGIGVGWTEVAIVFYAILFLILLAKYPELVFAGVQLLLKLFVAVAVAIGFLFIIALTGGDE